MLEGVEKPGNIGAVLRSADAAGVSALILADARTDLYNPNAIRASLGTIFTVPVCEASSDETLAWLREKKYLHRRRPGGWFRAVHRNRLPPPHGHCLGQRSRRIIIHLDRAPTSPPSACPCWARPTALTSPPPPP